jgi:hypothetical protein
MQKKESARVTPNTRIPNYATGGYDIMNVLELNLPFFVKASEDLLASCIAKKERVITKKLARRKKFNIPFECSNCKTKKTPQWRKGPEVGLCTFSPVERRMVVR